MSNSEKRSQLKSKNSTYRSWTKKLNSIQFEEDWQVIFKEKVKRNTTYQMEIKNIVLKL